MLVLEYIRSIEAVCKFYVWLFAIVSAFSIFYKWQMPLIFCVIAVVAAIIAAVSFICIDELEDQVAGSVNKVILVGNLGRDPEIKSFPSGGKIANFSIATSESWKDKQTGEKKERTEWHNVVIRNEGLVGVVEKYVKKGSKLYVEGSLQTRKWQDASGADRYTTEIIVGFGGVLTMLDSKGGGGEAPKEPSTASTPSQRAIEDDSDVPF